jgi:hypothetical protein
MTDAPADGLPDLSETEADAVHEVELGIEWLRRAHGDLLGVHHKTGHAFDHFDEAVSLLAAAGHEDLADALLEDHLTSGVVDGRWTYDLVESFESGMYDDLNGFERRVREAITDGQRHVVERQQEQRWERRAGDEQATGETTSGDE